MRLAAAFETLHRSLGAWLTTLVLAVALGAAPASAGLIGGPGPNPSLGADDGTELFAPNLNPNLLRHVVLVKEVFDAVPSSLTHDWGIYLASDPSTRIPVLTALDTAPPEQLAVIDFDNGLVVDLDASQIESTFAAGVASFGFYLEADLPSGTVLRYSEPILNPGGTDTFASFPFLANPLFYLVAFEIDEQVFTLEIVDGVIPVPEASTLALIGAGLAILSSRRRRA